jgi:hypothetical protein
MSCRPAFGILLVSLLVAASPAGADWLVTHAGGRVETKGPWRTKGKLVIFTQADGTLASLRLADVDLEASAQATAEAQAKAVAPPAPPPAKKKIAVLTDKDFSRPAEQVPAKPEGDAKEKEPGEAVAKPQLVTVASWQRFNQSEGIVIQGTLQNNSDEIAAGVGVEIQLYDEAGDRMAAASGIPSTASIQPRGTIEFRANFPGVFSFAEAKFETKGFRLDLAPAPDAEPGESKPPQ